MKPEKFQSSVTGKDHPQIVGGDHEPHSAAYCHMMNELDPVRCEYGCKWIVPYGYVQNASCPRHD